MYTDNESTRDGCLEIDGQAMPYVVSTTDPNGRKRWKAWVPFEGKNKEDLAEIHRMLRNQGFARFCQDGQLKLFPEDREHTKAD
ncbi:MAG TPA: hypothetical protein PK080_00330 [Hyphomonadaceae bacterium]|nr:hypothetical protein [Hyphomonadaceae bacterium]